MKRRPPRSTRTDTLFPYTTLFRSLVDHGACNAGLQVNTKQDRACRGYRCRQDEHLTARDRPSGDAIAEHLRGRAAKRKLNPTARTCTDVKRDPVNISLRLVSSEERRAGKECVSKCIFRW